MCGELDVVDNEGCSVVVMLCCWGSQALCAAVWYARCGGVLYLGVLRMTWHVIAMFREHNIWDGRRNTREMSISRYLY